jgi:hypothetical protein
MGKIEHGAESARHVHLLFFSPITQQFETHNNNRAKKD